jgi:hypothetical protein
MAPLRTRSSALSKLAGLLSLLQSERLLPHSKMAASSGNPK